MDSTLPHLKDSEERYWDSYWTRLLLRLNAAHFFDDRDFKFRVTGIT